MFHTILRPGYDDLTVDKTLFDRDIGQQGGQRSRQKQESDLVNIGRRKGSSEVSEVVSIGCREVGVSSGPAPTTSCLTHPTPLWLFPILSAQATDSNIEVGVCPAGYDEDALAKEVQQKKGETIMSYLLPSDGDGHFLHDDAKSCQFTAPSSMPVGGHPVRLGSHAPPKGPPASFGASNQFPHMAFPMPVLVTKFYFWLYFDYVLCSILPNVFSLKSHYDYVNSLVLTAFGGEETFTKWAENKSNQSYSRLQGDLNSQDGSTLDSDLIHLRGINRVFSEGVAPTDPDPGKEPCKLCLQALIPLIPDL